jgi:AcrR family transcriptional regulator
MDEDKSAKELLLERVVDHFVADGLGDLSLRKIATAIGTSHRMLLYHFGSKDGLLLEVVRAVEARSRAQLGEIGRDTKRMN